MKVDRLTDAQIQKISEEMKSRGVGITELESMARLRGVPAVEIAKLKSRLATVSTSSSAKRGVQQEQAEDSLAVTSDISVKKPVEEERLNKRIFGTTIFNNENLSFEPSLNIPTPKGYQVGVGDELVIDIWGASQAMMRLPVESSGNINVEGVGPIYVNGLTIEEANSKVIGRISSIYEGLRKNGGRIPDTFAQISLGNLRSIKVTIAGEAYVPGTYTLPSLATVFNALYLAGGPNEKGSFRKIKVIRNGKPYKTVDVYDFLLNGNGKQNFVLRDQDIILIPAYETRLAFEGEIKTPGLFEAKSGENMNDLVRYAGGFTAEAYKHRLEIVRKGDRELSILDLAQDDFGKYKPQNGDSITVLKILERYANKVSLEGAVYRTGNFSLTEGLTLSKLILDKGEGLKEDAFLNRGIIYRKAEDLSLEAVSFDVRDVITGKKDLALRRDDKVIVYSIFDLEGERNVNVSGEIRFEGEYAFAEGMTLGDLVGMAGGFKFGATGMRVEVARRNLEEEDQIKTGEIADIFYFDVDKDLRVKGEGNSFKLAPFDQVFVRKAPNYREAENVVVSGEVQFPGKYGLKEETERVSDIIARAGGLTNFAYVKGAALKRKIELSEIEIRRREQIMENDSSMVEDDFKDFEFISINLKKILEKPQSNIDLILQDGDELILPHQLQTVSVTGEVLNPVGVTYVPGKSLKYYINAGGGYSIRAKKGKTFVVYADGSASRSKKFLFFRSWPKVEPGAKVIVPERPERKGNAQQWIGIGTAAASLGLIISNIITSTK
ncbi:polysaccharide biosynthesis/export family protein [Fulvitalea axinellae]